MGRIFSKMCVVAGLLGLFSMIACKPSSSRLKMFGRTSNCGNFNIATDTFSVAVRECFKNDITGYQEGVRYGLVQAQQTLGTFFGYSAYGFRVKRKFGKDMCLTADIGSKNLLYEQCGMHDGRVKFKESQLFYFAKQDAETTVSLKNGRRKVYKDYLTHIIPQKSLNSWLLDADWQEKNKELLCVGLDYKPIAQMQSANGNSSYQLKECGSDNFLSVFLNLPSSYEGDDLLNEGNKISSLLLMGLKGAIWKPFDFNEQMDVKASTYIPNELFRNKYYKNQGGEFLDNPLNPANVIQALVQQNYKEAKVSVNLNLQGNTVNNFEYLPSSSRTSCRMAAFGNPAELRNKLSSSDNPKTNNSYAAELFCFENSEIHLRDRHLNANNGSPGSEQVRASSRYNASVVAVEACESGFSIGASASCDYYQTSRALADSRDNVVEVAGVEYPARNIVQLKKNGNSEDQNKADCLWLSGSSLGFGKCNRAGSENKSQYLVRNLDGGTYEQNALSNNQIVSGSMAKHGSILVPISNPSQCLIFNGSSWALGNSSGGSIGNCSLFRVEGNSLFLPYINNKTSELLQSNLKIGFCTGGVNLGANSPSVNVDCWDYVSRRMQLLVKIADIISMIPLLGIVPAAVMNGIVCTSTESSLNENACMNLIMGVVIDSVMAPFDIMGLNIVIGTFRRAVTKNAFKMAIKATAKEMGEEAAEAAAERAVRDIADPSLLKSSLRQSLGSVPDTLLDDAVRMSQTINTPTSSIDGAASRFKSYMVDLYQSNKSVNKSNFMDMFDEYWRGYNRASLNNKSRQTAMNAVRKAFLLDNSFDSAMRKELAEELIPEVLANGAGIAFWVGQSAN